MLSPGNRRGEATEGRWARLCELFDPGFLNLGTTDILGRIIFVLGLSCFLQDG